MTILSALQSAMVRLVGRKPDSIYGSTNETEVQIGDIANEVATDIMKGYDWRTLTKIASISGNDVLTSFDLPTDYDRMVLAQGVHDGATWFWRYTPCPDLDTWIEITTSGFNALTPGWWIILDKKLQFYPAPVSGAPARYPYISNLCVRSVPEVNTGVITPQTKFLNDGDTFVLDERLITLGVIWRYREQKGMGYAEDMKNYEIALSQEQARDRGSRVITITGRARYPNVTVAYPFALG